MLFQSANSADIRRAYRRLSLTLHPDKNKEEGAEEQFRQVGIDVEVLCLNSMQFILELVKSEVHEVGPVGKRDHAFHSVIITLLGSNHVSKKIKKC